MRYPDWQMRLTAYLHETAQRPYQPGLHDCALFAAGAVQVMTGTDLARGFRGYRTLAGGIKRLRQRGFTDHVDRFASVFPTTAAPRPGDLAVVPTQEGPAMGVVQGTLIYAAAPIGWALVPVSHAIQFFEV